MDENNNLNENETQSTTPKTYGKPDPEAEKAADNSTTTETATTEPATEPAATEETVAEPTPMEEASSESTAAEEPAVTEPTPMEEAITEPAPTESTPTAPVYGAVPSSTTTPTATYGSTYGSSSNSTIATDSDFSTGWGIASLILGILGLLLDCCYGFGMLFSILSIVFGIIQQKSPEGKKPATAIIGIICSVLGILVAIGMWIFTFLIAAAA